jgi:hypothetical protein
MCKKTPNGSIFFHLKIDMFYCEHETKKKSLNYSVLMSMCLFVIYS